jgi:hypothetical protein
MEQPIKSKQQFMDAANDKLNCDFIWKRRVKTMINGIKNVYPNYSDNKAKEEAWKFFNQLYLDEQ